MGTQGVDEDVVFALISESVALDFYARGQSLDIDWDRSGDIFLQSFVHEIEGCADRERGNRHADQKPHLLPERRGTYEISGLEVLRSGAGDGSGDANDAANHESEHGVLGSGPSRDEEDRAGGHESGDAHSADRVGRVAEESTDAAGDGNKEKSEHDDEDSGEEVLVPLGLRALDREKGEEHPDHGDDEDGADDDPAHGNVAVNAARRRRLAGALGADVFQASAQSGNDGGHRAEEGDEAGGGDRSS